MPHSTAVAECHPSPATASRSLRGVPLREARLVQRSRGVPLRKARLVQQSRRGGSSKDNMGRGRWERCKSSSGTEGKAVAAYPITPS